MRNAKTLALITLIFLSAQVIGLATAAQYQELLQSGEEPPILENPSDVSNSVIIFAYILVITGVIILIIKYAKKLLTVIEAVAVFFTSDIVFELLIPYAILGTIPVGLVLAVILTAAKITKPTITTQNLALVFSVAGAGAVLGTSLTIIPVLVFMLLLSAYDFVSVFLTKHMVYMAKAITEKPRAFTAAFPTRTRTKTPEGGEVETSHTHQLGGGDIVIPLMFASSLLAGYGITHAAAATAGALIALLLLFQFVVTRPGYALPALPPVSAGACLGFLAALLIP